jgi:lipopolysaccharide transport protein LptA
MKLFALLLILGTQIYALEATVPSENNKVKIKADRGKFDQRNNLIQLRENVYIDDQKMIVTCQSMDITLEEKLLDPKQKESQQTVSKKAKFILAEEKVTIKDENMTATGERAEYFVKDKKIRLTGNPQVIQYDSVTRKKNVFKGSVIIYYTESGLIEFEDLKADVQGEIKKK